MISLRNTQQARETRSAGAKQTKNSSSPFTVEVAAAASRTQTTSTAQVPGTVDLSMFTTVAIDRQASVAYSKVAEAKNYEIDFLHNQARENWELNGRRGPEPVKPQYHETESEKIFNHLQSFRHGEIAIPADGSGYLSADGYMSALPHQRRYGAGVEQLTAYSGSGYQQTKMPTNPATPKNADVLWGPATESLKS
jgi:hypothetical protein